MSDFARLGTHNMVLPPEGPKMFPNKLDFRTVGEVNLDFTLPIQRGFISFVQSAYIDNSANANVLYIQTDEIGQVFPFPAGAAGYIPLFISDSAKLKFTTVINNALIVQCIVSNIPVTPCIWFPTASGSVVLGAGTAFIGKAANADGAGNTSGQKTYVASAAAYTGYATPNDMLTIFGSATKTIYVTNMILLLSSTAAARLTGFFTKRSVANTGGTPTALTATPINSANGVATATVVSYGSAPVLGASVGDIAITDTSTSVLTAGATMQALLIGNGRDAPRQITDIRQPITLRGINESLSYNLKGAAIPAGFTASLLVEWTEV